MFIVLFFIYCDSVTHLIFSIGPTCPAKLERRRIEFRVAVETIKKSPPEKSAKSAVIASPKKEVVKPAQKKQVTVAQPKKKEEPVQKKEVIAPKEKKSAPTVAPPVPVAPKVAAAPPVIAPQPVTQEHLDLEITADKNKNFERNGLPDGIQDYAALYEDIVACWSPPPGIPADCSCTITIAIDRQGQMTTMAIDASSGVLMYDLAAQAAIGEIQFPHMARGKSITITFTV